jgi:hypothetical protein
LENENEKDEDDFDDDDDDEDICPVVSRVKQYDPFLGEAQCVQLATFIIL